MARLRLSPYFPSLSFTITFTLLISEASAHLFLLQLCQIYRHSVSVYKDVAKVVDLYLRGEDYKPEIRQLDHGEIVKEERVFTGPMNLIR